MGLTSQNSGRSLLRRKKQSGGEGKYKVCLVGNPNVGKSTIFNTLTGSRQHTGNWSGKTVELAYGKRESGGKSYEIVDLPGTYSLYAHSREEEVAGEYIVSGEADVTVVVCDSTNLERSLALLLQIKEITNRTVAVLNMSDEAARSGIKIDEERAAQLLEIPVVLTSSKDKRCAERIMAAVDLCLFREDKEVCNVPIKYPERIEGALDVLSSKIGDMGGRERFLSVALLCFEKSELLLSAAGLKEEQIAELKSEKFEICKELLAKQGKNEDFSELITSSVMKKAEELSAEITNGKRHRGLSLFDKLLTNKWCAIPLMLLLLFLILYLTVSFANYPSTLLNKLFAGFGEWLVHIMELISLPPLFISFIHDGVYSVLTSVVAVMLPPMAIFFPLFTLLEDVGLLPRLAFNLDAPFRCVGACGKQALTMCMGLGCNAAGITGCRIIDDKRERLLATVTNGFMPCNGKFPTVILLIGMFAVGSFGGVALAFGLLLAVTLGVLATFLASFLLTKTFYRGKPSFFTIELPPYRMPNVPRVLLRSLVDRTASVLLRAVSVAVPAGALIWLLAAVEIKDVSLLCHFAELLDPVGRLLGMDGVLLGAFILGLPANEIVLPIAVIGYTSMGVGEALSYGGVGEVLLSAGFTPLKAVCVAIFSLMHWPCSTALITVYKETKSLFALILSALLPTLFGACLCILVNLCFGGII